MDDLFETDDFGGRWNEQATFTGLALPGWLNPALSENTAAAMLRNLEGLSSSWGQLIASAQAIVTIFQDFPLDRADALDQEEHARPLVAAARILDSASQSRSGLNDEDRQRLALEAAVAFGMAGNFPSAYVCGERAKPVLTTYQDVPVILASAAPRLLRDLLRMGNLSVDTRRYLEQMAVFLEKGDAVSAEALRTMLVDRILAAQTPWEVGLLDTARLCLEHVIRLSVARVLGQLEDRLPAEYIARLLRDGIQILLPPQYRAILSRKLLTADTNTVIALPTSSGKTLLGELCLVAALRSGTGVGCYMVPYVALGTQVWETLRRHLPENYQVHKLLGGYRMDQRLGESGQPEVVVATPERFDSLMRLTPALLQQVRCVVCDEAHLIASQQRGTRLEGILTRLKMTKCRGLSMRIVLLSAVISNPQHLLKWMDVPEGTAVIDSWMPTARRVAIWRQSGDLIWYQADDPIRRHGATPHSPLGSLTLPWPEQSLRSTSDYAARKHLEPAVNKNVTYLVHYLLKRYYAEPVLVICATKQGTREVAREIARELPPELPISDEVEQLVWRIENRYPSLRPMCEMLRRRVAFHNSSLPHEIRRLVEQALRNRKLVVVAATTTLAEGVDLPFRCTVIRDWLQWDSDRQRPMSSQLFRNVAGRCGRAAVYTEGDTIVYDNPVGDTDHTSPWIRPQEIDGMCLSDGPEPVRSALQPLLDNIRDPISFSVVASQFLAAVPENPAEDNLSAAFSRETYAAQLHGAAKVETLFQVIARDLTDPTHGALAVANSPFRLTDFGTAANKTGFSPESCRRIHQFLISLVGRLLMEHTDVCHAAIRELGDLPEQGSTDLKRALTNPRSHSPVKAADLARLIQGWLRGVPLEDIFANLQSSRKSKVNPRIDVWREGVADLTDWDARFDKFMDFVSSVLENFLPWLLSACELLSPIVNEPLAALPWRDWARMMEHGVDSPWAADVLHAGAPGGRTAAALVGRRWQPDWQAPTDRIGSFCLAVAGYAGGIRDVFDTAIQDAGGAEVPAGYDVIQLQEWFWSRGGLTLLR